MSAPDVDFEERTQTERRLVVAGGVTAKAVGIVVIGLILVVSIAVYGIYATVVRVTDKVADTVANLTPEQLAAIRKGKLLPDEVVPPKEPNRRPPRSARI